MLPEVLYEDNHLLVVNKPPGLLTQSSGTEQENLESICKVWIKEKYHKPGNVFLHAVHRLDKPVGGIVIFARTSKALSRLQEALRAKNCKKIYLALVEKTPASSEGILEHYLIHDDYSALVSEKNHPQAKLARLHYLIKERRGEQALLEIELITGRYHQIRAQLAAIGSPIVGDLKYGSQKGLPDKSIALQHILMQISHPVTKEMLTFKVDRLNF